MMIRIFFIIMINIAVIHTFYTRPCYADAGIKASDNRKYRLVTDLDDQVIKVPVNPKRIAMLHGPSCDRILMLANPDIIALMPLVPTRWTLKIFPKTGDIPVITSYVDVDVEQMLNYRVDLVFFSMYQSHGEKLRAAGIYAACPFSLKKLPANINEFKENYKRQVIFFGEILGPDAMKRAKKYCNYFDKTIDKVLSVTKSIPENERPGVYYGGLNGNFFSTQGGNTVMQWCVNIAGGNFLTKDFKTHYAEANVEQLMAWDPEFIFIGMRGSMDLLNSNPAILNTKAYKSGNTYKIPAGTFWWDLASGETVLLPLFLAKKFHPDLFRDWDLIREMKMFYSEFYNYIISEKDTQRILLALPPG